MMKFTKIGSALTALLIAGTMTTSAFAVSAPGADVESYSYTAGKQAYASRMAEDHPWYDNEDDTAAAGYSYYAGYQSALLRSRTFEGMPVQEDMEDEEIEAWFETNGLGGGSGSGSYVAMTVTVSSGALGLRNAQSGDDSCIINLISNGSTVYVLDDTEGDFWYVYVPSLGQYGYVNSAYLS